MLDSNTFAQVKKLIEKSDVLISSHGYDELAEDGILVKEIISSYRQSYSLRRLSRFWKGSVLSSLTKRCK